MGRTGGMHAPPMRHKTPNLDAAMAAAQRQVLLDYAIANPEVTIGELASMKGEFSKVAGSLTVGELRAGKATAGSGRKRGGPGRAGRRASSNSADTRTKAARATYDAKVLAAVKAAGDKIGADEVREQVGGTADQVRTSLKRLIKSKKVKRSGRARATRYVAR